MIDALLEKLLVYINTPVSILLCLAIGYLLYTIRQYNKVLKYKDTCIEEKDKYIQKLTGQMFEQISALTKMSTLLDKLIH
jgi:predicted Zn-dependent protease